MDSRWQAWMDNKGQSNKRVQARGLAGMTISGNIRRSSNLPKFRICNTPRQPVRLELSSACMQCCYLTMHDLILLNPIKI